MRMSDLYDELTDIDGVGDATAEKILAVVDAYSTTTEVEDNLRQAHDYWQSGKPGYAGKYIKRAISELDE